MSRSSHIARSVFALSLVLLTRCIAVGTLAFGAVLLMGAQTDAASVQIHGSWIIEPLPVSDQIELTLKYSSEFHDSSNSSAVPLNQFRGIDAAQLRGSASSLAHFEIVREAGTFQCEGYLKEGNGGGTFNFVPSEKFVSDMRSLGYDGLSSDKLFSMAVHDVNTAYIRDLHALGIESVSADQLIAMRIHGVSIDFIKQMQSLGYSGLTPEKLIAMRIHGVTPDFVRELKQLRYDPSSEDLIAMRIHGVTPAMAQELKTLGYDATIQQMIAMRIHGATPDFIKEVKALGYDHPTIDQLISMRIHGVTPEFIRKTRSQGMTNLSIEQLVSMKIHGIY